MQIETLIRWCPYPFAEIEMKDMCASWYQYATQACFDLHYYSGLHRIRWEDTSQEYGGGHIGAIFLVKSSELWTRKRFSLNQFRSQIWLCMGLYYKIGHNFWCIFYNFVFIFCSD